HSIAPEGGAWYGIWNGEYPYHHLTQAVVQYEAVPPFVEQLPDFSDTWAEEKQVWADVVDLDGDAFSCTLNVTIAPVGANPYQQQFAMAEDDEVEGRFLAEISMDVGDTVTFNVRATDVTGRSSSSSLRSFIRVAAPSPSQKVLVLQDGTRDSLGGTWGSIYTSATGVNPLFGSTGYYVWNVNDRGGVDYDVINHSNFELIIKHGWAGGAMPSTGEDMHGFGDFLDRGGRLLYSDMDYFWKTDLASEGSFSEGDFAYDYLGLSYYWNDPDNDGDGANGGSGDLNHYGENNDPVTGTWEDNAYGPLDYELIGWTNWGDFMSVENAEHIFTGDQSFNKTGSRYNGMGADAPFKTVYFSFPIEAAQDFTTLLSNSVDWLMGFGGPEGSISQATPQDGETVDLSTTDQLTFLFGGSVSDPDGDLIGYKVVLDGDLAMLDVPATDGISVSLSAAEVADMLGEYQSLTGTWKVVASDGLESIESDTRTLTIVTGALSAFDEVIPKDFALMGNYPNPFNPETQIRIEMPVRAELTIVISDILGREINRLGNQVYSSGIHGLSWDGKSFSGNQVPSGIYFYEVIANDLSSGKNLFRASNKMVLMK
ncbi:MAG: FlgD immunoglobulin-like domain containing protein, partial [Candidatus Neomarinimicrobiota bacterium]|nr:FlgD immunoglobulin-like domain containing protein [Candidatus Neomarinimicrobiota bacterium]